MQNCLYFLGYEREGFGFCIRVVCIVFFRCTTFIVKPYIRVNMTQISLSAQPNPTQMHLLKSRSMLHTKPALLKHRPKIFSSSTCQAMTYTICAQTVWKLWLRLRLWNSGETTRAWATAPISLSRHRRLSYKKVRILDQIQDRTGSAQC